MAKDANPKPDRGKVIGIQWGDEHHYQLIFENDRVHESLKEAMKKRTKNVQKPSNEVDF